MALLRRILREEEGATMVEYALMVALIASTLISVVTSVKSAIGVKFTSSATAISGS